MAEGWHANRGDGKTPIFALQIRTMKFYNIVIKYRLQIAIFLLIIGVATNVYAGFWPAFLPYFVAVLLLFGYFFFGPLRLIQEHMESGNMEAAEKVLDSIKFPNLLYKPIRSVYFTLKGNIAMMKQDFAGAYGTEHEKGIGPGNADERGGRRQPPPDGNALHAKE